MCWPSNEPSSSCHCLAGSLSRLLLAPVSPASHLRLVLQQLFSWMHRQPRGLSRVIASPAAALLGTVLPWDCCAARWLWLHRCKFATITSGLVSLTTTAGLPVPDWGSRAAAATRGSTQGQSPHPPAGLHFFPGLPGGLRLKIQPPATSVIGSALWPTPPHC